MTRFLILAFICLLARTAASAQVIQEDYLTPAEVEKVRDTREPNQRTELFLQFAKERLAFFEKAWWTPPEQEPTHRDDLQEMLNNFIRAVDDTAETVDVALERGGANLEKAREQVTEIGSFFLARLKEIQQSDHPAKPDLEWDLEDAVMATEDLLSLAEKIPDGLIPPQGPAATGEKTGGQKPGPPGRPTLKRPDEKEEDDRPR